MSDGFDGDLPGRDVGAAVARSTEALKAEVAHEVRTRRSRVRDALAATARE